MQVNVDNLSWDVEGSPILSDICLKAEVKEFLGIVGPNGAGKSSLLRCVYRMIRPSSGTVHVGGVDIWRLSARSNAQRIAVVLQDAGAEAAFTVREVVEMGRIPHKTLFETDTPKDRQIVEETLARTTLTDLADRPFASLSGGERQRTLLARALAQQPRVLVLDEPTNHLDARYQVDVLHLVRDLGITVLATIHDLNLAAAFCDRLVMMNEGTIVADGRPDDVLSPDLIGRIFGLGADVDTHPRSGRPRVTFHHDRRSGQQ